MKTKLLCYFNHTFPLIYNRSNLFSYFQKCCKKLNEGPLAKSYSIASFLVFSNGLSFRSGRVLTISYERKLRMFSHKCIIIVMRTNINVQHIYVKKIKSQTTQRQIENERAKVVQA